VGFNGRLHHSQGQEAFIRQILKIRIIVYPDRPGSCRVKISKLDPVTFGIVDVADCVMVPVKVVAISKLEAVCSSAAIGRVIIVAKPLDHSSGAAQVKLAGIAG